MDLGISQLDGEIDVLRVTANAREPGRMNQLLLARHLINDTKQSDQTGFENLFQNETLPSGNGASPPSGRSTREE